MKFNRSAYLFLAIIIFTCGHITAQSSFGVRLGGPSQSYYVGILDLGAIKPFVGLDYLGGAIKMESDYTYTEWSEWNGHRSDREKYSAKGSLRLFMPRAGLKFCQPKKKELQTYLTAEAFIVIPIVSFESKNNGDTDKLDKDDKKRVKDALDFIGITAAWGAEYFLSEQFSIGGEAGINMILWNMNDERSDGYSEPNYNWSENYKYEVKARIGGSFGRMSINYYF